VTKASAHIVVKIYGSESGKGGFIRENIDALVNFRLAESDLSAETRAHI